MNDVHDHTATSKYLMEHVYKQDFDPKSSDSKDKNAKQDKAETPKESEISNSKVVSQHYDTLPEAGVQERTNSRIYHMRNFNNWIKSMLITGYGPKCRDSGGRSLRILDMCSGKGGDQIKFRKANADHVCFVDIASVSVDQSRERYDELCNRAKTERGRNANRVFTAEFMVADCTKERLIDKQPNFRQGFDMVSCQFAIHYSFESLAQARTLLRNVSESLRPGGYFIGTTTNAYEIVKRLHEKKKKEPEATSFGNEVYTIKFDEPEGEQFPLFGTKFNFFLEGVVDCPEFLTYFPLLEELAKEADLSVVEMTEFPDIFKRHVDDSDGEKLLQKMQCFEAYPAEAPVTMMSSEKDAYVSAQSYLDCTGASDEVCLGTMSKSEWETVGLYMAFAFKKN